MVDQRQAQQPRLTETRGQVATISRPDTMREKNVDWSLLSPQGHVLFYIALCPDCTVKEIARAIGHTERQIWTIIGNLRDGGMLEVRPRGRRHHFRINFDAPLLHPTIEDLSLRTVMQGAVEKLRRETPDLCMGDDDSK